MTKNIFIAALFMCCAVGLYAMENKTIPTDSYTDIFINTQKADITIVKSQTPLKTTIYWKNKLCTLEIIKTTDTVTEINISPKKQNVFLKKLLRIPKDPCKIKVEVGENKNIYASSENGDVRIFDLKESKAKLYTTHGVIEASGYSGDLSAETLTGRITVKNLNTGNLNLKTASGNIYAYGTMHNTDILNTSGKSKMQGIADSLRFYSSEGDLSARWVAMPKGDLLISARSFAGDINIILPPGTSLEGTNNNIELRSIYGTINIENN